EVQYLFAVDDGERAARDAKECKLVCQDLVQEGADRLHPGRGGVRGLTVCLRGRSGLGVRRGGHGLREEQ
ncbi:MAG: hypothetical protein WAK53_04325, partial [Chromatiaceae bacterium]